MKSLPEYLIYFSKRGGVRKRNESIPLPKLLEEDKEKNEGTIREREGKLY